MHTLDYPTKAVEYGSKETAEVAKRFYEATMTLPSHVKEALGLKMLKAEGKMFAVIDGLELTLAQLENDPDDIAFLLQGKFNQKKRMN